MVGGGYIERENCDEVVVEGGCVVVWCVDEFVVWWYGYFCCKVDVIWMWGIKVIFEGWYGL